MTQILVSKYGSNADVDAFTAAEDIISEGGLQYWPTTESIIQVSSSDAADADGGTGANSVIIIGVDAEFNPVEERLDLNGVSVVSTVRKFYRINRAEVVLSGSGQTNAGLITFSDGTGTLASIPIGASGTLKASYTVPKGYSQAVLNTLHIRVRSRTAAYASVVLLVKKNGSNTWRVRQEVEVAESAPYYDDDVHIIVGEGDDIVLRALSASADNLPMSGTFTITYESTNP